MVSAAALIVGVGVARTLSHMASMRQIESIGFITVVTVLLFLVGKVFSYVGVSAIVEGGA